MKKNQPERAMLEKMEAVPCSAKQKGLSGLGSFWASVGINDIHSNEKRYPEYLLRTDDMDYRIRPTDLKHPEVLPIGHEIVFKIKKDRMLLKVPNGDTKMRPYEAVAMEPANPGTQNTSTRTRWGRSEAGYEPKSELVKRSDLPSGDTARRIDREASLLPQGKTTTPNYSLKHVRSTSLRQLAG